jgi:hypothetical protein
MHTARTIGLIVTTAVLAVLTAVVVLALAFRLTGLVIGVAALVTMLTAYVAVGRPWHQRWGATRGEAEAPLPGDGLVPGGSATTRAITVSAPPADVWPWLTQIGWGRAGWYSYDWIDNDGEPSTDRIVPELQHLSVGDRILMTPDMGFVVTEVEPGDHLVALTEDRTTSWCLSVRPAPAGTSRLVSRFRADLPVTPASLVWIALCDPGAFVMERKMLKGIARRAGATPTTKTRSDHADRT